MTDNLGPLRQAMSDLAEHGGQTDLYERTLHRSRQLRRRAAVASGAAAVTVVAAIGGVVTYAAANRSAPPPLPAATPSASPAPSYSAPPPSSSPPSSSPPSSTPPSSSPPGSSYPHCPSAKALERLYELPEDYRFVPSSVECWRTWATVESEGPSQGDGVYLFEYEAGEWRYHSQGSAYRCEDLGIKSGNPPFCHRSEGN